MYKTLKNNIINYILEIEGENNKIYTIKDLTVDFSIEKNYSGSANSCNFTIYNLTAEIRNSIKKTVLQRNYNSDNNYRILRFYAGYNYQLFPLFIGSVKECCSTRQNENIITNISGWIGVEGINNSFTNVSLVNQQNIIEYLLNDFKKYLDIGFISEKAKYILKDCKRGQTLSGKTWELLNQYKEDLQIFIDNEKIFIYSVDEWNNRTIIINKETGLLNIPIDYGITMEINTIGEPIVNLKDIVQLGVEEDKEYNGNYGILGIVHRGTISFRGARTNWITNLKLQK